MDGNVENPYPAERMIALIANKGAVATCVEIG